MSALTDKITASYLMARGATASALLGAAMLALPLNPAFAASSAAPGPGSSYQQDVDAAHMHSDTVETRIASLHKALKITHDEEPAWLAVAQSMRDNAAAMQRLVADNTAVAPQSKTALDELQAYQTFAQAHVDGLKNLTASFETLYDAMPDAQKKIADEVFRDFGRKAHHSQG